MATRRSPWRTATDRAEPHGSPLSEALLSLCEAVDKLALRLSEHENRRCMSHPACLENKDMGRICWDRQEEERE